MKYKIKADVLDIPGEAEPRIRYAAYETGWMSSGRMIDAAFSMQELQGKMKKRLALQSECDMINANG